MAQIRERYAAMRNRITVTFSPAVSDDLRTVCGAIECSIPWFAENILQGHIETLLVGKEMGGTEATSLVYDSIEEAKRVTAACDKLDGKSSKWRFFENEEGKFEVECHEFLAPWLPKEMKEVAA